MKAVFGDSFGDDEGLAAGTSRPRESGVRLAARVQPAPGRFEGATHALGCKRAGALVPTPGFACGRRQS
jgi:hypothetical protein